MRRMTETILALAAALVMSAAAFAAGDPAPQTSTLAGVTVKVAPHRLESGQWEFSIVFDTHSQELNDDPAKSAVLVIDHGTPVAPDAWKGDAPGGHHRKGVLQFKISAAAGPAKIELRLQRRGEAAPRVFRWQLR